MPLAELLVLAFVLIALAAYHLWFNPFRRATTSVGFEHISDVEDGDIVSVLGVVERGQAIIESPLTGTPCVAYSVMVEAGGRSVVEECRAVDFWLRDATGKALVRASGAIVLLADPQTGSVGDSFADIEALLARQGAQSMTMNRTMRYREAMVKIGDRVLVTGLSRWDPERAGRRLILESTPEGPLRITDAPNDTQPGSHGP